MILEKEKITEKEIKDYSLIELLKIKREIFFSNDFYKYSNDEKKAFLEENKVDIDLEINTRNENAIFIAGIAIFTFGLAWGITTPDFLVPLSLMTGALSLMMFTQTEKFKKIGKKIWLSREGDSEILKLVMFFGCVVKEDVLKAFIKEYGQSELVNLLYKKECLTYKDLYDYINSKAEYKNQDIKKQKLEEAVKCLAEK